MKQKTEPAPNHDGISGPDPERELAKLKRSAAQLRRTEEAIRKVMASDSAASSSQFLNHMTRELAIAVGADFTLIGQVIGQKLDRIQTLSFFGEGRHQENFSYDLLDTPCEQYKNHDCCCFPAKVSDLFPRDLELKKLAIDGYLGIPLYGSRGNPLGILVALYLEPVKEPEFAMSILQLFSARIAGEMERIQGEERLRDRIRFEQLVVDLSSQFIRVPHFELDQAINQALASIGEFACADRAYIFQFREDQGLVDNTHEWCEEGIESQIDQMQNVFVMGELAWFGRKLEKMENISIPDVADLPPEAKHFKRLLEQQNIRSVVSVPMVIEERLVGFLGFDFVKEPCEWPADHTPLLRIIGEIITNAQERRRRELEIRESGQRTELALTGAELGMYDWNIITGELAHDERWAAMLGYSSGEMPRNISAWEKMVHPDDLPDVKKRLTAHLTEQTPVYESEHRLKARSGDWVWVLDKGKVMERKSNGQPLRITGTQMNITARKRAEQTARNMEAQIRHAQKLESLGVLAGGIAHDFNNLLMVILGNADLALSQLSPIAPARECLREIEIASRRAADLCNQMLAYSGKSQAMTSKVILSDLVREMTHMLEVTISKKATLKYLFANEIPPVEGDSTQIGQVVMNLITNASEALEDGVGTITVTTGSMRCDETFLRDNYTDEPVPEGEYVFIEVTDTGHGMNENVLSRLFDPFFTTKFTGRGLGLSAVLGIVRSHLGAMKIRSAEGKGTTFLVLFPIAKTETDQPEEAEEGEQAALAGGGTILVVDDEQPVREVAEKMLFTLGFDVILAANGAEGLDQFDKHREKIRCVLLDRTMPDMDGEQVLKRIREIDPDVPVIQISGYGKPEKEGSDPFIQKPFTLSDLENNLSSLL